MMKALQERRVIPPPQSNILLKRGGYYRCEIMDKKFGSRVKTILFWVALFITAWVFNMLLVARSPPETKTGDENYGPMCPYPFLPGGFKFERTKYERAVFEELPTSKLFIIGANVGSTETDATYPLLKDYDSVRKIFVEPIPPLFDQLAANIKRDGIENAVLENVAIGHTDGHSLMFCWDFNNTNLPSWFTQICSFDRSRLYNNTYDTAAIVDSLDLIKEENIVEFTVQQATVKKMFEKHTILGEISVVQIDTEGFDFHIVNQLPFQDHNFRPCVVTWEYVLLSGDQNYELIQMISKFGYGFTVESQNLVMYRMIEM